jgi:hypothetical protein
VSLSHCRILAYLPSHEGKRNKEVISLSLHICEMITNLGQHFTSGIVMFKAVVGYNEI